MHHAYNLTVDVYTGVRPRAKIENILDFMYKNGAIITAPEKKVASIFLFDDVKMLLISAFTSAFEDHAELLRWLTEQSVKHIKFQQRATRCNRPDTRCWPAIHCNRLATRCHGK